MREKDTVKALDCDFVTLKWIETEFDDEQTLLLSVSRGSLIPLNGKLWNGWPKVLTLLATHDIATPGLHFTWFGQAVKINGGLWKSVSLS